MIRDTILNFIQFINRDFSRKKYLEIKRLEDKKSLTEFQENNLQRLLLHAYNNVPYYRSIFKKIGLIQDGKVDMAKFGEIPILTKEIIRKEGKNLLSEDFKTRSSFENTTGGSTGEPLNLIQDRRYSEWGRAAFNYYYKDIVGIDERKAKKILLWGSERDIFEGSIGIRAKISNWLTKTKFLNSFRMKNEDILNFVKIINSHNPELLRGYASSLYEISSFINKEEIHVKSPRIIVSAAENLTNNMRESIEKSFKNKVYDFYGTREVSGIAGECKEGLLHIFSFWNFVEVIDANNNPVTGNEEGRIIVTNLYNYSMPFIRYEIGDNGILGPEQCLCGSILPTLKKVTGRITDSFLLKDGTKIPAEYFIHLIGVVCNKGSIKKFQVVQIDYNKIEILFVPNDKLTQFEINDINDKIKLVMGNECEIIWKKVLDISKTTSGKYIYTKSLLK